MAEVRSVCTEVGPEGVSISKIGKALGVSSGAPFRLFPTRAHIFAALVEAEMERLDAAFAEILSRSDMTPVARLGAMCHAYIDHAHEEPAMFRLAFSFSAKATGADQLQTVGQNVYGKVRQVVALCLPEGSDAEQLELRTYLLWATVHGHVMLRMMEQLEDQNIELADKTIVDAAITSTIPLSQE